jgi:hypothetical protein
MRQGKKYRWLLIIAASLLFGSLFFNYLNLPARVSSFANQSTSVSLINLIINPYKYHAIKVRVIGFVRLEFEGNVIYPYQEDYIHSLLGNGVWIDVPPNTNLEELNLKYCLIEGTFDATDRGHKGLSSGSIKNINRFEAWSDPANPRRNRYRKVY